MLYQSDPGGDLSDVRIAPAGDRVAFFKHTFKGDDCGLVMVVDQAGKAITAVSRDFWGIEGLAGRADGRALYFSGSNGGGDYQLQRTDLQGESVPVIPSPGSLTMQDLAPDGRLLVTRDDQPRRLTGHSPAWSGERERRSWTRPFSFPRPKRVSSRCRTTTSRVRSRPSSARARAMALLEDLRRMSPGGEVAPFNLALLHLGLGDSRRAIDEFEQAYAASSQSLVWLKIDRIYDPLRSEPRFIALMQKLNFSSR